MFFMNCFCWIDIILDAHHPKIALEVYMSFSDMHKKVAWSDQVINLPTMIFPTR